MQFDQFISILLARKKTILFVFVLAVAASVVLTLLMPKTYTAESSIIIDVKSSDPVTGEPVSGTVLPAYIATQLDVITSPAVSMRVMDNLNLVEAIPEAQQWFMDETGGKGSYRDWLAKLIGKGLEVQPSRESSVINIAYSAPNAAYAAQMANAFAQAYIQTVIDLRTSSATQNSSWYKSQIESLKRNLVEAQNKLADFQQKEGIVGGDERIDVETQKLNEIASQLIAAQAQTYDAQTRADRPRNGADIVNNPVVQQLRMQISTQEGKLKELEQNVGPNHPRYVEASAELRALQQQLSEQTTVVGSGLVSTAQSSSARQAALQRAMQIQKTKVLELKTQRSKLDILQRDVENAQKTYDFALQRLTQQSLESRSNYASASILKPAAEPSVASRPRPMLNLFIGTFLGLFLGLTLALALELLRPRIRGVSDLKQIFEAPVVKVSSRLVPKRKRLSSLFTRGQNHKNKRALA